MTQVVEAVPNFSEGRDAAFPEAAAAAFASAGCEVFHVTADPDHHRSVVTVVGPPGAVEEGAVAAAKLAVREIDMRRHRGVHPRVGAMDVLPFVPLHGVTMEEAARLARRAGRRIARLGVPVYFYGRASQLPGRRLASIRRGGFEALIAATGDPRGLSSATPRSQADLPGNNAAGAPVHRFAHPTAGAVCIGARPVLLAWNVDVEGASLADARAVAAAVRESGDGFAGVRAIGARLPRQGRLQVSMNVEDLSATDPRAVFQAIERLVKQCGGQVISSEVIGMIPEPLSNPAAAQAVRIREWSEDRLLDRRLSAYLAKRNPTGRGGAGAGITFPA